MNRFAQRRILVTGGASGIGRATVLRLLVEGGRVVAADVHEDGLAQTHALAEEKGTGNRLHTLVLDVGDEDSVSSGAREVGHLLGGLDVLVNAAGILRAAHTHDTSLELWNRVLTVNLTGTFLMTRQTLPMLLEGDHGVVVNFSSTAATFAHPYMAAVSRAPVVKGSSGSASWSWTLCTRASTCRVIAVAITGPTSSRPSGQDSQSSETTRRRSGHLRQPRPLRELQPSAARRMHGLSSGQARLQQRRVRLRLA